MQQGSSALIFDDFQTRMHEPVPYPDRALRNDLDRLMRRWEEVQQSRERTAIYRYLAAVFELNAWWTREGMESEYARRAVRRRGLVLYDSEHPCASIIRCTADPEKVDKRTRSKWSRVMAYAESRAVTSDDFSRFVQRKGGINKCAEQASKRLGRPDRATRRI